MGNPLVSGAAWLGSFIPGWVYLVIPVVVMPAIFVLVLRSRLQPKIDARRKKGAKRDLDRLERATERVKETRRRLEEQQRHKVAQTGRGKKGTKRARKGVDRARQLGQEHSERANSTGDVADDRKDEAAAGLRQRKGARVVSTQRIDKNREAVPGGGVPAPREGWGESDGPREDVDDELFDTALKLRTFDLHESDVTPVRSESQDVDPSVGSWVDRQLWMDASPAERAAIRAAALRRQERQRKEAEQNTVSNEGVAKATGGGTFPKGLSSEGRRVASGNAPVDLPTTSDTEE
jgi:hypothetical protein